MSERKVISKYYPLALTTGRFLAAIGLRRQAPNFKRGTKFNAQKETTDESYLGIQIIRFYIRCPRCSSEITFKTDPKNSDYATERGAKRNVEPWRPSMADETDEQRLDRLSKEEDEAEQSNPMLELEAKTTDARREMAVADALDEIRIRSARMERRGCRDNPTTLPEDIEQTRTQREDAEAARRAFKAGTSDIMAEQATASTHDVSLLFFSSKSDKAARKKPTIKGI